MHDIENIKNNHNDRTGINKTRIESSFYTSPSKNSLFTHVAYSDNTTVTTNNGFVKLSLKCKQSITANVYKFLPGPSFHDMIRKAIIPVHLPHGLANSQVI